MRRASIVIPVFNRAHLVHRALDSALAQTIPCEILLVDHGSTDDIGSVVDRYRGRIRYLRRSDDTGVIAAWRDGIEQATGELVHLTFDDDWIDPRFMERCVAHFGADVGFVYSRVRIHWERRGRSEPSVLHPPGIRPMAPLVRHLLRSPLSLSPGCAVFRREDALSSLVREIPGAAGRYGPGSGVGEDLLLFLLTSLRYPRYHHVPQELAHFLGHESSITVSAMSQGRQRELAEAYQVAKRHYLTQQGAIPPKRGMSRVIDQAVWLAGSRAIPVYAAKASRRLVDTARGR